MNNNNKKSFPYKRNQYHQKILSREVGRFSHSSLPVNTVYNVYKITAQVMNGTQWASQSGVSSG